MANIQLLCERYNGANRKYISQNYPNLGKTLTVEEDYYGLYDNTYVNATMAAGTTPDNYFSTATLVAKDKVSIRDGFCATFNLNDGMSFGRNESSGMNGLVSFAWTSCDMGFWSDYHNGYTRAFPDNLAFCTYRLDTQNFADDTYKGGGLAPSLWNNKTETYSMISYGDCGFTLTLYPDKDANENSVVGRKVKHFKLCVKKKDYSVKNKSAEAHIVETNNNVIVYEDDLPEEVDLTDISSIALSSRDELGYVNIFLNGVNIVSFFVEENCSLANMNYGSCIFSALLFAKFQHLLCQVFIRFCDLSVLVITVNAFAGSTHFRRFDCDGNMCLENIYDISVRFANRFFCCLCKIGFFGYECQNYSVDLQIRIQLVFYLTYCFCKLSHTF